jgi:hypothetical protein
MGAITNRAVGWFQKTFTRYGPSNVADDVARKLKVRETIPGALNPVRVSTYVQQPGQAARELVPVAQVPTKLAGDAWRPSGGTALTRVGKALDMTPDVPIKPGDVLARGNGVALDAMSLGGLSVSVERFLKTGKWQVHKGDVGHVAVAGIGPKGQLGVYEVFVGAQHPDLEKLVTKAQAAKPHAFIRFLSIDAYFNDSPRGWLRTTTVLRAKDPDVGARAAARAKELFDTQVSPDGQSVKPWFNKASRRLDPSAEGRTGPCSGFTNAAYDYRFDPGFGIPVAPEAIDESPILEVVGTKTIEALEPIVERFKF